jgi:hypothetical protein
LIQVLARGLQCRRLVVVRRGKVMDMSAVIGHGRMLLHAPERAEGARIVAEYLDYE